MTSTSGSPSSARQGTSSAGAGDTPKSGATPFLVVTCCAQNEDDVLDAFIAFHLSQGADLVLVTDHASDDETPSVLEEYRTTGRVLSWVQDDPVQLQREWMTGMAEAAVDLGATWVINADADEFWMSRYGSLRELFHAVPDDVDLLHAFHQDFLPPSVGEGFSAKHQTVWDTRTEGGFYVATRKAKVAHRARRGVVVGAGSHRISGLGRRTALGWLPIDILHFPIRSFAQLERKITSETALWRHVAPKPDHHERLLHERYEAGTLRDYYRDLVDPDVIAEGLASGRYAEDRRLADELAQLRRGSAEPDAQHTRDSYVLPAPDRSSEVSPEIARAFRIGGKAVSLHTKALRDERKALRRELARLQRQVSGAPRLRRVGERTRRTLAAPVRWARRAT
jgi:hypothetical protein